MYEARGGNEGCIHSFIGTTYNIGVLVNHSYLHEYEYEYEYEYHYLRYY